jgi:hypothetical protein
MTEIIFLFIILIQFALSVWKEIKYDKQIAELKKEIKKNVFNFPEVSDQTSVGIKRKKLDSSPNSILRETDKEIQLNEIPFMEIPKDFKIEHEGSSETPAEAVARKGN